MQEAIGRKHRGLRFGAFEADLDTRELRKHGIKLKLSGQPFRALELLLVNQGEIVTREELRIALWPGENWGDYDQRLNKTINKVREALSDSADNPRLLETVPRVGYRFLCPAVPLGSSEPNEPPSQPLRAETETFEIHSPSPVIALAAPAKSRSRRSIAIFFACVASVIGLAAYVVVRFLWVPSAPISSWGQATALTTYVGSEQYPEFSPDGKTIAFAWDGGNQEGTHIFTLSVDGGELVQMTKGTAGDYAPVWSPDTKSLAFVRASGERRPELWMVSASGGQERKLVELGDAVGDNHPITWTRNPRWLISSSRPTGDGPPALYLTSAESGVQRRLTSPSLRSAGDMSPVVSPDGTKVAFTRGSSVARRDIYMLPLTADLSGGEEPVRITDLHAVIDTITWTPNGKQLYFSVGPTVSGNRHIAHTDVDLHTVNRHYTETGIEGIHPAISASGNLLCYVRTNIEQTSIWRLGVSGDLRRGEPTRTRLISSTRRDYTADLSPDGKRIVFSSVRSGESEIWVSDAQGGGLRQITRKGASTPRWSPDGRTIAYESPAAGEPDVYVFDVGTNQERRLTFGSGSNLRPSWSRDGRFVYFGSSRTGESQIWKVPSSGGKEWQVTHEGGTYAAESFDGKSIYFTAPSQPPSVRVKRLDSDQEKILVEGAIGFSSISLANGGLFYLKSLTPTGARLNFFDFADKTFREIAQIAHPVHHFLSSPPDGNLVLYTQVDREDRDLMLMRLR